MPDPFPSLHRFMTAMDAALGKGSLSAVVLRDATWEAVARDLRGRARNNVSLLPELPTSLSYAGIVLLRASDVRTMVEAPP